MPRIFNSIDELRESSEINRPFLVAVDSVQEANSIASGKISYKDLFGRIGKILNNEIKNSSIFGPIPAIILFKIADNLFFGEPFEREEDISFTFVSKSVAIDLSLGSVGRSVFARHPAAFLRYFPIATYHDDLFQDKLSELERLLAHLGAKSIFIEYLNDSSSSTTANSEVSLLVPSGPAGKAIVGSSRHDRSTASLSSGFPKPKIKPSIPTNIAWLQSEPLWRQLAELRIKFGRESYELEMEVSKDYGISSELALKLVKMKLDIGGEYKKFERRRVKIKVDFWPLEE